MEWITNRNTKEHQAGKGINTDLHRMEHMEGAKQESLRGMLCAAATSPRANQGRNENKEHCLRRGCATTCFSMIVLLLEFEIISYLAISKYVITNLLLLLI